MTCKKTWQHQNFNLVLDFKSTKLLTYAIGMGTVSYQRQTSLTLWYSYRVAGL